MDKEENQVWCDQDGVVAIKVMEDKDSGLL